MNDQQHPITPPKDVIEALRSQAPRCDVDAGVNKVRETQLVIAAYRAGADAELEAILEIPEKTSSEEDAYFDGITVAGIRENRRPKPPSLAELALRELERTIVLLMPVTGSEKIKRFNTIRAALKRLQELEQGND